MPKASTPAKDGGKKLKVAERERLERELQTAADAQFGVGSVKIKMCGSTEEYHAEYGKAVVAPRGVDIVSYGTTLFMRVPNQEESGQHIPPLLVASPGCDPAQGVPKLHGHLNQKGLLLGRARQPAHA